MDQLNSTKIEASKNGGINNNDEKSSKTNSLENKYGRTKSKKDAVDRPKKARSMIHLTQRLSGIFKHEVKPRRAKVSSRFQLFE